MGKHDLVKQTSWRPTTKWMASFGTGAAGTIVLAVLAGLQTIDTDTVWGAAVVWGAAQVAAYVKRQRTTDR